MHTMPPPGPVGREHVGPMSSQWTVWALSADKPSLAGTLHVSGNSAPQNLHHGSV